MMHVARGGTQVDEQACLARVAVRERRRPLECGEAVRELRANLRAHLHHDVQSRNRLGEKRIGHPGRQRHRDHGDSTATIPPRSSCAAGTLAPRRRAGRSRYVSPGLRPVTEVKAQYFHCRKAVPAFLKRFSPGCYHPPREGVRLTPRPIRWRVPRHPPTGGGPVRVERSDPSSLPALVRNSCVLNSTAIWP
jgi:hypothetical protein